MDIRAAVLWEQGAPLSVEPVALDSPRAGEVLVEVRATGVCHSDLHATSGDWPMKLPLIPGHEGAGIVREIGSGVTRVAVGDHVVLCWAPSCGACASCSAGTPVLCDRLDKTTFRNKLPSGDTRLRARDQEIAPFLGTACFASHTIVPQEGLVRVSSTVPFHVLAAVGCAVVTGVGAVTNAAKLRQGSTVVVIGAGGVGVNVIQGAAIAGASRIIAVDREAAPLTLARLLGATDTVQPTGKTSDAIRDLIGGRGADYVFDTVGTPGTLTDAILSARKGGTIVLTGLSRIDAQGSIRMYPFVMQEKRLIGSVYGSGDPLKDIAHLVGLYEKGRLKLDELATRTYPLDGINEALAALARGDAGRGILLPQ